MLHFRAIAARGLTALAATAALAAQLGAQSAPKPLPLKYVGPATVPEITAGDLMTRLYIYADDSLMGREVGSEYHLKATAYLEHEVRRLGLKPGGDNGTYFQDIHVVLRAMDTTSTFTAGGVTYHAGADFLATTGGRVHQLTSAPVIYWGGSVFDSAAAPPAELTKGKLVLVRAVMTPAGLDIPVFLKSAAYLNYQAMQKNAAAIAFVSGDEFAPAQIAAAVTPNPRNISLLADNETLIVLRVTTRVADAILGAPIATAPGGTVGKSVSTQLRFSDVVRPGRNVVAILPGSDKKLRGEFVAIGAHNDHVGFNTRPVEHDSMKVFNTIGRPAGAEGGHKGTVTPEEWVRINSGIDSLRKIYPARPDSIYNGADDDGSGSVSVLEMAEKFARGHVKPKRSILFIWHAGEERGMWGSGYFTDHPTVPRDSIVAEINIDMVGRGASTDVTGTTKDGVVVHGADKYVQLVGSRRLSTELGDLAESVNKSPRYGFKFDYSLDANGHPQNIYCRSDHAMYAAWGIPVVFFTTGGHADYHQVTDEPQYIRYDHMALLDNMIFDLAVRVADLDHRVLVDGKKMADPHGQCQQ